MHRHASPVATGALSIGVALFLSALAAGQSAPAGDGDRHYDARIEHNRSFKAQARAARAQSLGSLAARVSDLSIESEDATGALRSLSSHTGYLTEAAAGEPMALALAFVRANLGTLGLAEADLEGYEVTDVVPSAVTGATHIYLRQRHRGIAVYNAQLHVNVNRDGRILSVNNSFLPDLASAVKTLEPRMDLPQAVRRAVEFAGRSLAAPPALVQAGSGPQRVSRVASEGISRLPIEGRLMLLPVRYGDARLVWSFQIHTLDETHSWDLTVDAEDGKVWTRADWTAGDQYRVYPLPAESPNHKTPLPPADGRVLLTNPASGCCGRPVWRRSPTSATRRLTSSSIRSCRSCPSFPRPRRTRSGSRSERRPGTLLTGSWSHSASSRW